MHGSSGNRIRLIRQQHTAIIEELLHAGAALATEGPAQSVGTAPTLEVSPPVVLRHPPLQERVRGASSQGGAATEFKGHWTRCSHQRSSTLEGTQVAERSVFSFQKTQKHMSNLVLFVSLSFCSLFVQNLLTIHGDACHGFQNANAHMVHTWGNVVS